MTTRFVFFDRVVMAAALGVVVLALALIGDPVKQSLAWTRTGLEQGEWWRLISGHWVHLGFFHAVLNASVLILLTALFGEVFTLVRQGVHALMGMLVIDAGLWWLGGIEWYVGLSGVLHTMAAAAVVRLIIDRHDRLAWLVALFGLSKIIYENNFGAMPFSGSTDSVVTDAHLFGVLAGMIFGLVPDRNRKRRGVNDLA